MRCSLSKDNENIYYKLTVRKDIKLQNYNFIRA